jgi:hypothetical protein
MSSWSFVGHERYCTTTILLPPGRLLGHPIMPVSMRLFCGELLCATRISSDRRSQLTGTGQVSYLMDGSLRCRQTALRTCRSRIRGIPHVAYVVFRFSFVPSYGFSSQHFGPHFVCRGSSR